jgi:hypothetical protein
MIRRVRMARKRLAIAREQAKATLQRYYSLPSGERQRVYWKKERRMNQAWAVVRRKERIA